MKIKLPSRSSKYGALMGCGNTLPDDCDAPVKLFMERMRWVDGDYGEDGTYWGQSKKHEHIYAAYDSDKYYSILIFVRGMDRDDDKYSAVIDGIESLILAHACAGVDIKAPTYRLGIETAIEDALNNT